MSRPNDLSRSFSPFDQQRTLVVVIEMSQSSWLVSGIVPGVDRQPLKKLDPDENALLRLLQRWRGEAEGRARRSSAPSSPSRPAGTASGSRGGSGHGASRRTSCIRRASRSLESTVEPRPTGSTPSCSSGHSSAGFAASASTVRWSPYRRSERRMPSGQVASGRASWLSRAASSIG